MRTLHVVRSLGASDWRLLAEAARLLLVVRIGLAVFRFPTLHAWLRSRRHLPDQPIVRVAWAVRAVSRRVPGTTCLAEALMMESMLLSHGHAPALRIGVRAGDAPVPSGAVDAHAWVECDGKVVIGGVAQLADYGVLS